VLIKISVMCDKLVYIINESEISAGTRGSCLGPGAIRVVDHQRENYLFGKYRNIYVPDENHLLDEPTPLLWGKRANGLAKVYEHVSKIVAEERNKTDFLLVVAADHGSAGGTIAGLKMANPNHRIAVLWVDAHGDLHTPYTTPSGNMHGMPLSTALNEDNLQCQKNDVFEETAKFWHQMKTVGGIAPKILPQDLAFIGLRDLEQEELDLMARLGLKNIPVEEYRSRGIEDVTKQLEAQFADCDEIYVSFDVDSMDPKVVSHGTGTPVDNGLFPEEASDILTYFAQHPKVKCIEFVEVNPCLDEKTNRMAEVAYELIQQVVKTVEEKR
jgi:arginase